MVLCGGTKHRRTPDIYIFNQRVKIVRRCQLCFERVQIDGQNINAHNTFGDHRGNMLVIVASRQKSAMDFGM